MPPIQERRPEVPEELALILERMLAKDREGRFASPADVALAMEPFADGAELAALAGFALYAWGQSGRFERAAQSEERAKTEALEALKAAKASRVTADEATERLRSSTSKSRSKAGTPTRARTGSWPALAEILPVDEHNNSIECPTGCFLDSDDNVIFSAEAGHLISTIGLSDMIVVHSRDATLICPKDQAQRVKELVNKVRDKYGEKFQ